MKKYLLLGVGLAMLSCSATKQLPHYTAEQQAAQRGGISWWQPDPEPAKRDSTAGPRVEPNSQLDFIKRIFAGKAPVVQQDLPGDYLATPDSLRFVKVAPAKRRLFGLLPPKAHLSQGRGVGGGVPRKCKGCTFNVVGGDQHNQQVAKNGQLLGAGASSTVTGKKSGDIIKADSGATVNKSTTKNGQAAAGEGISQQHEETEESLLAPVVAGLGTIAGIVLVYWLVAGGGALWVVGLFKRRNAETQA